MNEYQPVGRAATPVELDELCRLFFPLTTLFCQHKLSTIGKTILNEHKAHFHPVSFQILASAPCINFQLILFFFHFDKRSEGDSQDESPSNKKNMIA